MDLEENMASKKSLKQLSSLVVVFVIGFTIVKAVELWYRKNAHIVE